MISNRLLDFVKQFEGCSLRSYQDTNGYWTIGYGDTHNVRPNMTITQEEAEQRLKDRLQSFEIAYKRLVDGELNDNQHDAIMDFIYNVGPFNFEVSHLRLYINNMDWEKASDEFPRWTKDHTGKILNGLVKRRTAERELFLTPV
jgi:lysozyme